MESKGWTKNCFVTLTYNNALDESGKPNLTKIDYQRFWDSIKVTILESDGGLYYKTLGQLKTKALTDTITLNNVTANPYATILQLLTTKETAKFIKTKLGKV